MRRSPWFTYPTWLPFKPQRRHSYGNDTPAAMDDNRHIQLSTNIARSLSGTALDQLDTIPYILAVSSPHHGRRRRSTVFQRRISTDQLTLAGRIMRARDYSNSRTRRSRPSRKTRSVSDGPSINRKLRDRSRSQRKSRSLPRISNDVQFGGRDDEFERKVKRQSKITRIFGDWKHKIWKKSQYRAFSI